MVLTAVLYALRDLSALELVTIWSAVMMIMAVPIVVYYGVMARRHVPFKVSYVSISKYSAGGAGIALAFLLTHQHAARFEDNFLYLFGFFLEAAICCAVYIGITYAVDRRTGRLLRMMLLGAKSELRRTRD